MKYFTNDYDTYAAESLEDVKAEMIALGILYNEEDEDFCEDDWEEESGDTKMFTCLWDDIDVHKYQTDDEYKQDIRDKYLKTLDEVFASKELSSATGKAWFMCSTEY